MDLRNGVNMSVKSLSLIRFTSLFIMFIYLMIWKLNLNGLFQTRHAST